MQMTAIKIFAFIEVRQKRMQDDGTNVANTFSAARVKSSLSSDDLSLALVPVFLKKIEVGS